ncbi:MAG: acyl-CoA dehydrogenase, partial [Deltaproteobacteria bacterium]|nr:acyl-CoA dehydrogenase [Deltaproteobacteria bacterium]
MINLELTKELQQTKDFLHGVGKDLFRPIARKYDVAEHEYPKELDVMKAAQAPKEKKEEKDKGKSSKPKTANLMAVISTEEVCWGDLGLTLTIPGRG